MHFWFLDIVQEMSDSDVLHMVNTQLVYVTCDSDGIQRVDCTPFRLFCDDFTFAELALVEHTVHLITFTV